MEEEPEIIKKGKAEKLNMEFFSLKKRVGLKKENLPVLALGLIIGATAVLSVSFLTGQQISPDQAADKVLKVVESQTGQQLEVVNVQERSGMYQVNLRDQNDQLSTFYVSKDGKLVTSAMTNLESATRMVAARNKFSSCLADKNVVLYGNASQQATRLQIQLLGGTGFVENIYKDVNNQQVLREAAQRGVQRVPSFYYNGSTLGGVNRLQAISSFTGCSRSSGQ